MDPACPRFDADDTTPPDAPATLPAPPPSHPMPLWQPPRPTCSMIPSFDGFSASDLDDE